MKLKNNILRHKPLLLVSLFCFLLFVAAYRQNNVIMLKLRDDVFKADKESGDVETALRKLREHVYGHMNTDLTTQNGIKPPIQLQYRYDRLVTAEKNRVADVNSKVYTDAQTVCERINPTSFSGGGRVACIQDYVSKHGAKEQPIPDVLYKFDFVSPRWSFDLAGWSLIAAVLFLAGFLAQLIHHRSKS